MYEDIFLDHIESVELKNGNVLAVTNMEHSKDFECDLMINGQKKRVRLIRDVYNFWGYYESSLGTFEEDIWECEIL